MAYRDKISGNVETIEAGDVVTVEKLIDSIEKTLAIVDASESKVVIFDEGEAKNSRQFLIELSAKVSVLKDLIANPNQEIVKK